MKRLITLFTLLVLFSVAAVAQDQLSVRSNFNVSQRVSIAGTDKWVNITNPPDTSSHFQVNADQTISAYDLTSGVVGYAAFDSVMVRNTIAAFTIADRGTNVDGTSHVFAIYFVDSKDRLAYNGYRIVMFEAGNGFGDNIYIQLVTGGSSGTFLATIPMTTPFAAGDQIIAKLLANNQIMGGVYHANGVRDTAQITDATYALAAPYVTISGKFLAGFPKFDNFSLGRFVAAPPAVRDQTPPTIPLMQVSPVSPKPTDFVSVQIHALDSLTPSHGLDSLTFRIDNPLGTHQFTQTWKFGDTKDTTVFSTGTAFVQGTYYYYVERVRDDSNNVATSGTNIGQANAKSFIVSPTVPPVQGQYNMWIMNEYPYFAENRTKPQDLPWQYMTHLMMFNGNVMASSPYWTFRHYSPSVFDTISFFNGDINAGWGPDPGTLPAGRTFWQTIQDSASKYGVKVIVEFTCETQSPGITNFNAMIMDTTKQDAFIASFLPFCQRNGVAGFSVNAEYPTNSNAWRTNFDRFASKVRAVMDTWNPKGIFGMTITNWLWWSYNQNGNGGTNPIFNVSTVNNYLDFVALEMYGFQFGGSTLGLKSPLHQPFAGYAVDDGGSRQVWDFRGIGEWKQAGVDSMKLIAMVASEAADMNYSGSTPQVGITPGTFGGSFDDFMDVYNFLQANPSGKHFDANALVPWVAANGKFYTYEDSLSLFYKVQYSRQKGIKGMAIWDQYTSDLYQLPKAQRQSFTRWLATAVGNTQDTSAPAIPAIPTQVSPINSAVVDPAGTVLTWNSTANAAYYSVVIRGPTGAPLSIAGTSNIVGTTFTVPSVALAFNTSYTWAVASYNSAGTSQGYQSVYASFITKSQAVTIPAVPTLVFPAANATNVTSPLTFRWNKTDSTTSYQLQAGPDSTAGVTYPINQTGILDTTFTFNGSFTPSTDYFWHVKSVNSNGTNGYSAWRKFTTLAVAPPPPVVAPKQNDKFNIQTLGSTGTFKSIATWINNVPLVWVNSQADVITPDTLTSKVFVVQGQAYLMQHDRTFQPIGSGGSTQIPADVALTDAVMTITSPWTHNVIGGGVPALSVTSPNSQGTAIFSNTGGLGRAFAAISVGGNAFTATSSSGIGAFVQSLSGNPFVANFNGSDIFTVTSAGANLNGVFNIQADNTFPYISLLETVSGDTGHIGLNPLGGLDIKATGLAPVNGSILKYDGTSWKIGSDLNSGSPTGKLIQDSLNTRIDTFTTRHYYKGDTLTWLTGTGTKNLEIISNSGLQEFRSFASQFYISDNTGGSGFIVGGSRGVYALPYNHKQFAVLLSFDYATELDSAFEVSDSSKAQVFTVGSRGTVGERSGVTVGTHSFTTTATTDTVTIGQATTSDIYFLTPKWNSGTAINANDLLTWEALTGKLVVHRLASGSSGLTYSWRRVRPK